MSEMLAQANIYYDPFAPEGFDPMASMAVIKARYDNKEVEPDYSADQVVSDIEALYWDTRLSGLMDKAFMIEQAMRDMCGDHDSALRDSVTNNPTFGRKEQDGHNDRDLHTGHGHGPDGHGHNSGTSAESKKKKRRPYEGLLAMLARISKVNQDFRKNYRFLAKPSKPV